MFKTYLYNFKNNLASILTLLALSNAACANGQIDNLLSQGIVVNAAEAAYIFEKGLNADAVTAKKAKIDGPDFVYLSQTMHQSVEQMIEDKMNKASIRASTTLLDTSTISHSTHAIIPPNSNLNSIVNQNDDDEPQVGYIDNYGNLKYDDDHDSATIEISLAVPQNYHLKFNPSVLNGGDTDIKLRVNDIVQFNNSDITSDKKKLKEGITFIVVKRPN